MQYFSKQIETNLVVREITRGEDLDLFIDLEYYSVDLKLEIENISRIQFPRARAVLLRLSPYTSKITIHFLEDTDLLSSFINFELDLANSILHLEKKGCKIEMYLQAID